VNDALEEKRSFTDSRRRPIILQDKAPQSKKDSGNHRRLRLENSSSCGVFSRLGL